MESCVKPVGSVSGVQSGVRARGSGDSGGTPAKEENVEGSSGESIERDRWHFVHETSSRDMVGFHKRKI